MNGYKQKNGDVVIMLTHDWYPAIIFDQMIKCGSSILMGAKMKIVHVSEGIYFAQKRRCPRKFSSENQTYNECIPSRNS